MMARAMVMLMVSVDYHCLLKSRKSQSPGDIMLVMDHLDNTPVQVKDIKLLDLS